MTGKLQVTIPKAIVDRDGIQPGQELEWFEAGDAIRVVPEVTKRRTADPVRRLEVFDRATERQRAREAARPSRPAAAEYGWSREELYGRGDGAG